jgi:hypothetical protein
MWRSPRTPGIPRPVRRRLRRDGVGMVSLVIVGVLHPDHGRLVRGHRRRLERGGRRLLRAARPSWPAPRTSRRWPWRRSRPGQGAARWTSRTSTRSPRATPEWERARRQDRGDEVPAALRRCRSAATSGAATCCRRRSRARRCRSSSGWSPRCSPRSSARVLGAAAGYFGGWVNDFLEWVYNVFTSIPYILLILAFAAVLTATGKSGTIMLILGLTGWTGIYRLMRAEYIKHANREYVRPRRPSARPLVAHVRAHPAQREPRGPGAALPAHRELHQGRGDPVVPRLRRAGDMVSWGTMLAEAQEELVIGKWWQLAAGA